MKKNRRGHGPHTRKEPGSRIEDYKTLIDSSIHTDKQASRLGTSLSSNKHTVEFYGKRFAY